jgi:DNA-binding XRE family transcriptional regulator
LGLRQFDVAKEIGVYPSTLNTWENHHFSPDVRHIPRIVAFLGYNPFGPLPDSYPLRLKAARIGTGLTRRDLAAKVGVHPATVAEWERGKKCPNRKHGERLSVLLRLSARKT